MRNEWYIVGVVALIAVVSLVLVGPLPNLSKVNLQGQATLPCPEIEIDENFCRYGTVYYEANIYGCSVPICKYSTQLEVFRSRIFQILGSDSTDESEEETVTDDFADDATDDTDDSDVGDNTEEETTNVVSDYALTKYDMILAEERFRERTADKTNSPHAPNGQHFFFDEKSSTLYVDDHIGVYALDLDGLEASDYRAKIEFLTTHEGTSGYSRERDDVVLQEKIWYGGDQGGWEGGRASKTYVGGTDEVIITASRGTSRPGVMIVVKDKGDRFFVEGEAIPKGRFLGSSRLDDVNDVLIREDGAPSIVGSGIPGIDDQIYHIFSTPDKRYALSFGGVKRDTIADFNIDRARILDITEMDNPIDLGRLAKYDVLYDIVEQALIYDCETSRNHVTMCVGGWGRDGFFHGFDENRIFVLVKDGEHIVYDYSDIMNIVELDRYTNPEGLSFVGGLNGLVSHGGSMYPSGTVMDDSIYYVLPAQDYSISREGVQRYGIVSQYYNPDTTPAELLAGSVDVSPLREQIGEGIHIYRHKFGNDDWEQVVEASYEFAQLYDGKVFFYGRKAPIYNLDDPTYFAIYDIESKAWLLEEEVPLDPSRNYNLCIKLGYGYQSSFPVTKKGEKYYAYLRFGNRCAIGHPRAPSNYLIGYEFGPCEGSACSEAPEVGNNLCIPDCSEATTCGDPNGCGGGCSVQDCSGKLVCMEWWRDLDSWPSCVCPNGPSYLCS